MSRLEEKKLVVDELKKVADEALSAVVVDYRGTNVPDLTLLRKDASSSSVYLRVIKNTPVSYTHLTLPTNREV